MSVVRILAEALLVLTVLWQWWALQTCATRECCACSPPSERTLLRGMARSLLSDGVGLDGDDGVAPHLYAVRTATRPSFTMLIDLPHDLTSYFVPVYLHGVNYDPRFFKLLAFFWLWFFVVFYSLGVVVWLWLLFWF